VVINALLQRIFDQVKPVVSDHYLTLLAHLLVVFD
jgi:hypothetical protein